ncbi:hypothetical protein F5883DRAFT_544462 [Diaporthe sp. PMI_573]|nr:hypothetical protein F5883DRAFT_544462 [Diaporthaceae sp. PMI_573]
MLTSDDGILEAIIVHNLATLLVALVVLLVIHVHDAILPIPRLWLGAPDNGLVLTVVVLNAARVGRFN